MAKSEAPQIANAIRVSETDGIIRLDFAYTDEVTEQVDAKDVMPIASVVCAKGLIKIMQSAFDALLQKENN